MQVPSAWKPTLEDFSTLQIFFDYYALNQMFSKEVCFCQFIASENGASALKLL